MSADLLARLIEAGTPAALVAEVAMLAAEVARVEQRVNEAVAAATAPTAGALRMRRYRERAEASRSVTCDASDAQVTASITEAPSPDKAPQTPKINPTPHVCVGDAPTRKARAWACPSEVDPSHWADLLENRKRKRQANTATAYDRLLRDLTKFADDEWPPGRIIQHAAERGWAALFDPRNSEHRHGQRSHHDRTSRGGSLWAAVHDDLAPRESDGPPLVG